jgi:hypothetical protein
VKQQELSPLLVGMQNGVSLVISYKIKHTLIMQPSDHGPWYLPKGVENL